MWESEVFDCSGYPDRITWTWSATLHETSSGIGCASGIGGPWVWLLLLALETLAVWVKDPSRIHESTLTWPTKSVYSLTLKIKKQIIIIIFEFIEHKSRWIMISYPVCIMEGALYNQGMYLATDLFSRLLPFVISMARYWAKPHFRVPPKVSSFKPACKLLP